MIFVFWTVGKHSMPHATADLYKTAVYGLFCKTNKGDEWCVLRTRAWLRGNEIQLGRFIFPSSLCIRFVSFEQETRDVNFNKAILDELRTFLWTAIYPQTFSLTVLKMILHNALFVHVSLSDFTIFNLPLVKQSISFCFFSITQF